MKLFPKFNIRIRYIINFLISLNTDLGYNEKSKILFHKITIINK